MTETSKTETPKTDIQELYFRDPLEYSKQSRDEALAQLIADLRAKRKNFQNAGVPAKSSTRKTVAKSDPTLDLKIDL